MASRQHDDFQVIQLLQWILQNSDLTKLTRKQVREQLEEELGGSFSSPQWKARIKHEIEEFVKRDQSGINTYSVPSVPSDRIQIIYSASMQSNDVKTEKENKEIEGWKNRYNELNDKMNKMSLEMNGLRKEYENEKDKNILFEEEKNRMIQHQNEDLRDKLDEDDKKKDDEIFKIRFDEWLNNTVKLKQYLSVFVENECNDVRMIEFFEDELIEKEIGIKNIFHRKLIIKEAKQFKKSQDEFNDLLNNNKKLKPFKEILTINGILRLQDFKKYIKNKQQFAKMLNIMNDDKINQIWTIFNGDNIDQIHHQ